MQKLYLFLIFGLLSSEALGKSFRNERQAEDYNYDDGRDDNADDDFTGEGPLNSETLENSFRNERQAEDYNYDDGRDDKADSNGGFPAGDQGKIPNQDFVPNQGMLPNQVPNQGQLPNQGQSTNQGQQPISGNGNINGTSLTQSSAYIDCIRRCPVTSEYNPVCGSDSVTYDNPGRLTCAQNCGLNIRQFRTSRCPATLAAPATS